MIFFGRQLPCGKAVEVGIIYIQTGCSNPYVVLNYPHIPVKLEHRFRISIYQKEKGNMKKRYLAILVVLVLLIGVAVSTASAGKFSYTSGIQVQNLSATDANVTLTYYMQDGTVDNTVNDTIVANGSNTYFPVGASDGFNGSVIISSDQPVSAISNILGNSGAASASYVGSSTGGQTVNLPLLMKGNSGYDTWFNVQNTGSTDATVNVAYSDGTTVGPITIKPGAAYTFDQATETHSAAVFSAVVTSDQNVAVTVMEESSSIMFAYSGFTSGSTNPVMPLVNANNAGFITGIQIQNTGNTDTDVTVTYTAASAGSDCTETQTIPANSSATFALGAFSSGANSTCTGGATFIGSAAVTANSAGNELTAIVNQLGPASGEAYGGFDPAVASDVVVMPLIMDRNSGYFTGFNVQNVGSAATTVDCTFTNSTYTVSATLQPGEAMSEIQNGMIADGYVGSATCTAGSGGLILGVVNELGPSSTSDQLLVYEATNN